VMPVAFDEYDADANTPYVTLDDVAIYKPDLVNITYRALNKELGQCYLPYVRVGPIIFVICTVIHDKCNTS
jgi:hypothetical protein